MGDDQSWVINHMGVMRSDGKRVSPATPFCHFVRGGRVTNPTVRAIGN
jgi:hypothetical protein